MEPLDVIDCTESALPNTIGNKKADKLAHQGSSPTLLGPELAIVIELLLSLL